MRSFLLIVLLALVGVAAAHACCYSRWKTGQAWESGAFPTCEHYLVEFYEWKELWPTGIEPDHDHYWIGGTEVEVSGPYPIYNCPQ